MAASMPVRRPRRKSGAVISGRRHPQGAELHKRSAEASGFDLQRAHRQNRAKREDVWLAEYLNERQQEEET